MNKMNTTAFAVDNKSEPGLDSYLTKRQLAHLLHVTPRTVNNYVAAGHLPVPLHVGRLALWSKSELTKFLAALQPEL